MEMVYVNTIPTCLHTHMCIYIVSFTFDCVVPILGFTTFIYTSEIPDNICK